MRRHAKAIVAASALLLLTMALGVNFATATAPTVSIDAPSSVSYTSVHLSGKVNPEDQDTYYYFQYTTEPGSPFGWQWAGFDGSLTANSGEASVEGDLNGLTPATEYFVRLVAENADGQTISAEPHPSFTTDAVAPAAVSIDAPSAVIGTSAHFSGTIDPEAPGGNPAAFDVSWRFECTPACPGLSGTIPADSDPHAVEADATGLKPGTAYEVTLIAENAGGSASAGPEGFTTDTQAPQVEGQSAQVSSTEATLEARVNPGGLVTTYFFEYGPTASYGQSTATKTLPAGGDPVTASANVFGLDPESRYHFRVVVSNAEGSVEGADQGFTTAPAGTTTGNCPNEAIRVQQGSQYLPDCRAFELVSPADKGDYAVQSPGTLSWTTVSADGDTAVFASWGRFADVQGGLIASYRARRSATGWNTEAVSPVSSFTYPDVSSKGHEAWIIASANLESGFVQTPASFDPTDTNDLQDIYRLGPNQEAELISRGNGQERVGPGEYAAYAAVSPNGKHVFFATPSHLVPEDAERLAGARDLYDRTNGETRLVNIDNDGTILNRCGSALGSSSGFFGGVGAGATGGTSRNAISPDGSRIFFHTPAPLSEATGPDCEKPTQVYMRENNSVTVHVSASQRTVPDPGGPQGAEYQGATPDGSKVFFNSEEMLTDDAEPGGGLYRYDVESEQLAYLLPSFPHLTPGLIKISSDGSHIYFASYYDLATEEYDPDTPRHYYVLANGQLRKIFAGPDLGIASSAEELKPVRTTADGRYLMFTTGMSLTDFDHTGYAEIYIYDYERDAFTCVSCDPAGQRPAGSELRSNALFVGADEGTPPLTPDGDVVFETGDQLVAGDTNDARDIYEYHDGRVSLISSGRGSTNSTLLGTSEGGKTILFYTSENLVGYDTDDNADVYAARIGGGFLRDDVVSFTSCQGDACQGVGATPPAAAPVGSLGVAGFANAKARKKRCGLARHKTKGKARKTRCAKPKKARPKDPKPRSDRRANVLSSQAGKGR